MVVSRMTGCRRGEAGFTLIELIVILVALGLLAAVAVPKYLDLRAEAEYEAARSIVSAARSAIALDFAHKKLSDLPYRFPQEGETITIALQRIMDGLQNPPMRGFTWVFTPGAGNTPARVSAILDTPSNPNRPVD
jgi:type II secretory pathway pseudopilin PulG